MIAVGVAVGGVVVLLILAAVAIPVFLNERDKGVASRTTVSVPASVEGMAPLTDPVNRAYVRQLERLPGPGQHVAGGFGDAETAVFVGAGRHYMSSQDRDEFLSIAPRRASESAGLAGLDFHEAPAGALGGRMRCGSSAEAQATLCFFADAGSYGMIVVRGPLTGAERLADAARSAFVHRR